MHRYVAKLTSKKSTPIGLASVLGALMITVLLSSTPTPEKALFQNAMIKQETQRVRSD